MTGLIISSQFGRLVNFTHWLMSRMGLQKRNGAKGIKHLQEDFENIKTEFLDRINKTMTQHKIPDSLIINWDQSGCNYIPVSVLTMEEMLQAVPIAQLDDKHQLTVLLACTKSGQQLPLHPIYQGCMDACHLTYNFPQDLHVMCSESHWSNADTMYSFVEVIVPYVDQQTDEQDMPLNSMRFVSLIYLKLTKGKKLGNTYRNIILTLYMFLLPVEIDCSH